MSRWPRRRAEPSPDWARVEDGWGANVSEDPPANCASSVGESNGWERRVRTSGVPRWGARRNARARHCVRFRCCGHARPRPHYRRCARGRPCQSSVCRLAGSNRGLPPKRAKNSVSFPAPRQVFGLFVGSEEQARRFEPGAGFFDGIVRISRKGRTGESSREGPGRIGFGRNLCPVNSFRRGRSKASMRKCSPPSGNPSLDSPRSTSFERSGSGNWATTS
jgi:hypothetical protein